MAGNRAGGLKASQTNRRRYGPGFYKSIGRLGGLKSSGGGFAKDHEFAQKMGRIGGAISRRVKAEKKANQRTYGWLPWQKPKP